MRNRVRASNPTPAGAPPKPLFLGFRVPLFFPTRTCCREHNAKHVRFGHSHAHRSQDTRRLGVRSTLSVYVPLPKKHAQRIAVPGVCLRANARAACFRIRRRPSPDSCGRLQRSQPHARADALSRGCQSQAMRPLPHGVDVHQSRDLSPARARRFRRAGHRDVDAVAKLLSGFSTIDDYSTCKIIWHVLNLRTLILLPTVSHRWSQLARQAACWAGQGVYIADLALPGPRLQERRDSLSPARRC